MTTNFRIEGMHCHSCKLLIEDVCKDIPGVQDCQVNVEAGTARVEHAPDVDLSLIEREITQLGEYHVTRV